MMDSQVSDGICPTDWDIAVSDLSGLNYQDSITALILTGLCGFVSEPLYVLDEYFESGRCFPVLLGLPNVI